MEALQKKLTLFLRGHKNIITITLLCAVFLLLRLYKLDQSFIYGLDEEYLVLFGRTILKDFHIIWIGVSAANVGYYLGPGLVYLTALILGVGGSNPLALGYAATGMSLMGFIALMYVSKDLFGKRVALITSILYLFSPFALYYDHKYWPALLPAVCVLLYYSIVKLYKNPRYIFAISFFIATGYHLHLTLWLFWPIIYYALWQNRKSIRPMYWIISVGIFLLITSPLLVFDIIHNFDNILMPLRLIDNLGEGPTHTNHLSLFTATISKMWLAKEITSSLMLSIPLVVATILFFLLPIMSSIKKNSFRLLSAISLLFSLGFSLYPGPMQEYYAVFLLPFWAIAAGVFIARLPKLFSYILIVIIVGINTYSFATNRHQSDYLDKIEIVKRTSATINGEPYYLDFDDSYRSFGGFRSLFALQGQTPAQSKADGMFGWLYTDEISSQKPTKKVTISRDSNLNFDPLTDQFTVGAFTVYIE